MLIPLSWLQEFVDINEDPKTIESALNQLGLEVEGIEYPAQDIVGVRAARILNVHPHPSADKVRLADIDFGDGKTTVVCGAPILEVGMVVPYASVGVTLPNGLTLTPREIRGVVSDGMLCSPDELGLEGSGARGLLNLPTDLPLGSDVGEAMGKGEVVFDLSITPNRPDAMCVIGVARELAAHFKLPLKKAAAVESLTKDGLQEVATVDVREPKRAPRYIAWRASVEVKPSPAWLARRLTLAGHRPINNVVDVTNYVLLERNQPLHAFDFDRMKGVVVRTATEGETIKTLDGKERKLDVEDLLICDVDGNAQAIAGVMGGENSEITESTTQVLLEAAYFESHGISLTSRRLGLRTDASSRFDRGIDPDAVADAAARAMQLLVEVADAIVAPEFTDVVNGLFGPKKVHLRPARVNALLGTELKEAEITDLLEPLGFSFHPHENDLTVEVPTFRPDVTREIDLVEEVARTVGYQNIPKTMRTHSFHRGALTPAQAQRRTLNEVMLGAGFDEAKCFPLVSPGDLDAFGVPADSRTIVANPLREEESILTPSLLPPLVKSVGYNLKQGNRGVALFEMDRVFLPSETQWMNEIVPLAGVVSGTIDQRPVGVEQPLDIYMLTKVLGDIRDALRLKDLSLEPAPIKGFELQSSHNIMIDGVAQGVIGYLAPAVLRHFDISQPVAAFEISTEVLNNAARRPEAAKPISSLPPSYFDLAFIVDAAVTADALIETVRAVSSDIELVRVFDVYAGEHVPEGQKSIAVAVTVRSHEKTLTDKDMHAVRDAAIAAAKEQHSAVLRGA